jgi:polysaccharide biosynthesis transport protein
MSSNNILAAELAENAVNAQKDSMHEYIRVLNRHRVAIFVITVLFGILGALNSSMEVPLYRATSTLLIERDPVRFVQSQETFGTGSNNYEYYQTQYEILRTRPIAERVVDRIGADRILDATKSEPKFSFRKLLPWSKPVTLPTEPQLRRDIAIGMVMGAVGVAPVRNSQLVRLSYEVADPELAAVLANQLGDSYIESTLDARLQMISKANSWLEEKSKSLKKTVDDSQAKMTEYAVSNGLSLQGNDVLNAETVQMVMPRLAQAKADRLGLESRYQQVLSARRDGTLRNLSFLASGDSSSRAKERFEDAKKKVVELSSTFGEKHPRMVEARREEASALSSLNADLESAAESLIREYESARNIEAQLQSQLGSAQAGVQSSNRKMAELERLQRDYEANKLIYQKFQNQEKETDQLSDFRTTSARMVELASNPSGAFYPNIKRSMISAALLGLLLSVLLAFVLEHLDNTIKTAEDVERHIGVPVLGMVPLIKLNKNENPMRYFLENAKSSFSESLRTVRTGVLLSSLDKQHRRLLVTSSVPGEGKTTISLNLAQALSQMNKVLLIDADLRRPTVARVFGDGRPQKGLSQFIAGEAKISECVNQLEGSNTYVMTAGVIPNNPLELISSNKFSEALDNLGKAFDFIVIDCAPALAVSDALVLSRLVDGVLYVVRADETPRQAIQSGVKRLRRVEAPIMGIVINRVGERSHGYGYGRYSYYADGYYAYGYDSKPTRGAK